MTRRRWFLLVLPALWAGMPAALRPQRVRPTAAALASFGQAIDSLRRQLLIPGMSAAVVYNGEVIWSQGYGYADRENGVTATPHTTYEVASLSKPIGAVLLLRLVQQGKVKLDDPMSKYSAEYTTDSVHVRHVLTHTSEGIPGSTYRYNGTLFANLFDVIVKASERRYREMMSNDILVPLHMTETAPGNDLQPGQVGMQALLGTETADRYGAVVQRLAKPYRVDSTGGVVPSRETVFGLSPANGVVSTVLDLARFDAAIDRNVLLPAKMKKLMWTPPPSRDGHDFPYALGWFVQRYGAERLVWHYGYLPNRYSALYLKRPEAGLTLLLLANSDGLSSPFPLGVGDVTRSAFACAFLSAFTPTPATHPKSSSSAPSHARQ